MKKFSYMDFLKRHAKAFLFVTFLLALSGIAALSGMPVSLFPDITFPRITILADNGEQPVERMMAEVTQPLEEVSSSLLGVKKIRSVTGRGSTEISISMEWGTNITQSLQTLQGKISDIRNTLPANASVQAEQMTVSVFPIQGYSLTSEKRNAVELHDLAYYQVRPALMRIPGIAKIEVTGGHTREYLVECNPEKLQSYGITAPQVAEAISKSNQISAFGLLEDHYQIYLSLASELLKDWTEIGKTIVTVKGGRAIPISAVAVVKLSVKDLLIRTAAHGTDAVLISVLKQPQASTVEIGQQIQTCIQNLKLPGDVHLENYYDQGDFIRGSIDSTRDCILIGIGLAMLILFLFLKSFRVSLIIALVVPFTLAATFACLKIMGQTINIMTLGGIAAAVGLIIDDSIVVIEYTFAQFSKKSNYGLNNFSEAADKSIREMLPAILGSTATTLVIYIPMAFLGGLTGSFFAPLSITMVFALIISFFFSITLTPLLALILVRGKDINKERRREEEPSWANQALEKTVRKLLIYRWAIIPISLGILAVTGYFYTNVATGFLPDMDEGSFVIDYESPPGTSLAETNRMLIQLEKMLVALPEVDAYSRRTGTQLGFFLTEPNRGDYTVKLKKNRKRDIEAVIGDMRNQIESSLPALRVDFGQLMADVIGDLSNNPSPIEIKLFGENRDQLQTLAKEIKTRIEKVTGVVDVFNGIVISGPSFLVHIDNQKAALAGFASGEAEDILTTMQNGKADSWIQNGGKMIPIRIRYPDAYRSDIEKIKSAILINSQGQSIPLKNIANFEVTEGQSEWNRESLRPVVAVTARIEGRDLGSTIHEIQNLLKREIALPQGISLEYGGLYQNQQESFRGLLIVSIAALLLVFAILLIQFREFAAPTAILIINALSLIGVLGALRLTGVSFNVSSFVGLILIIGIVAENAVFILHAIHLNRESGESWDNAITHAILHRSRPILMTMLAAVCALLPLSLGLGAGAQMQQPLAIAVIGGFSTSSIFLLFGLPMVYRIFKGQSGDKV